MSPGPDAAELVLLAHARRIHDTLGCRRFLVASADRRFAELATLGRVELLVGSEPPDPQPDHKPVEPTPVPADRVSGLALTGPVIRALATGVGIGIGQRMVDVLLRQRRSR